MKFINASILHRKSGVWGTRQFLRGQSFALRVVSHPFTEFEFRVVVFHLLLCGWDRVSRTGEF